jgi:hypothetical protein
MPIVPDMKKLGGGVDLGEDQGICYRDAKFEIPLSHYLVTS